MSIPVAIPVKKHVLKYLIHSVGTPYKLSKNDYVGQYLFAALRQQNDLAKHCPCMPGYTERFELKISRIMYFHYLVNNITPTTIVNFNNYIHSILYNNFITWMDFSCMDESNKWMKDAVNNFMDMYNITEDDLSWEAWYKSYYRYRKKNSLKLYRHVQSFNNVI